MKNILARIAAFTVGVVLFVGAFLVSVVFFAVALAAFLVLGGYFLWRTRHLRRQMQQRHEGREIIEGTVVSSEDVRPASPSASLDQRDTQIP